MKKTTAIRSYLLAASALCALAAAPAARASGFGLREGSADWLGNAFVGG